jgi:cyanate lyase
MNRQDVTEMIIINKKIKALTWLDIANKIGLSKEWATAAPMSRTLS